MNTLSAHGLDLIEKGYNIIPIAKGRKFPSIGKNWQDTQATAEVLDQWINTGHQDDGIGILTHRTPAIDLDVRSIKVSSKLLTWLFKHIGAGAPVRTGNYPKCLIPCRLDVSQAPMGKRSSAIYESEDGQKHQIEILGKGQQFVAFGIHEQTQKPYTWSSDIPEHKELPALTAHTIDDLFDEFDKICVKEGFTLVKGRSQQLTAVTKAVQDTLTPPVRVDISDEEMKDLLLRIPSFNTYDDWIKVGMACAHQYVGSDKGREMWDFYSQRDPKTYNPIEIAKKYTTFATNDPNGITLGTLRHLASPPAPTITAQINAPTIKTSQLQASPDVPDTPDSPDEEPEQPGNWYDNYIFLTQEDKFQNIKTNVAVTRKVFSAIYARNVPERANAANYIINRGLVPLIDKIMYVPSAPQFFKDDTGAECYNSFKGILTKPLEKKPSPSEYKILEDFVNQIIPDPEERNILRWFLKYVIDNPGKRVNWAPILLGVPGSGKTTFSEMMTVVLGSANSKVTSPQELTSNFNGYAEGSMLTTIEEVRISGHNRYSVLENLKPMLTNATVIIHNKGVKAYPVPNVTNYIMFTNHSDALPIETTDRRYCVIQTVLDPRVDFTALYKFIEQNPQLVRHFITDYTPTIVYNPKAAAPKTSATHSMTRDTTDDLDDEINDMIESGTNEFVNQYFVSVKHIVDALQVSHNAHGKTVATRLQRMGYTKYSSRPYFSGERLTLYVLSKSRYRTIGTNETEIHRRIRVLRNKYK